MWFAGGQPFSETAWDEAETLSAVALRDLGLARLRDQLDYVMAHSAFYREKFRDHRDVVGDLRTLDDLARLPFTEKDELRASLEAHPPFGDYLAAPRQAIVQCQASSGTTGRPSYMAYTAPDLRVICEMQARCFYAADIRPGDVVLHGFALSRGFVGGIPMLQALSLMGATILPIGAEAGPERLLRAIVDQRPAAMIIGPSFVKYVGEQAERIIGCPAHETSIRTIVCGGEGGLPANRAEIEALWGATAREMYGMSDVANAFFAECDAVSGMHFTGQGYLHLEVIDPETGQVLPIEPGVQGEAVYTALRREAQPLVRFRSHDHVEVVGGDGVAGRAGPRIRMLGRTDDMLIVRGVNVHPGAVRDLLADFGPEVTGAFRITADFQGHSTARPLKIRIESAAADDTEVTARLQALIRERLGFRSHVEMVPPGTFPRPDDRKVPLVERIAGD